MNHNPVGWFEIYVKEMDRARKFYESVFKVSLTQMPAPVPGNEMWSFPMIEDAAGCPGALVRMEGMDPQGFGTIVYFSCDDCDVELSRVEDVGGTVHLPKTSIGEYGFYALVVDTEGNTIGLHSNQ